MPQSRHARIVLIAAVLAATVLPARAEPLFTLGDEGRTFLYRARPGDHPALVAEMFGIPARDLPALLAANGISDPTKVGAGFTYRIPNAAAQALADRAAAVDKENAGLRRSFGEERQKSDTATRAADDARAAAVQAERRAAQLERLERLWPWTRLGLVLLVLAVAGAAAVALAAVRRQAQAERWAHALDHDLEEKRKAALVERQESGKRILDLEGRVRTLEAQLGPRVVIGGRGGS